MHTQQKAVLPAPTSLLHCNLALFFMSRSVQTLYTFAQRSAFLSSPITLAVLLQALGLSAPARELLALRQCHRRLPFQLIHVSDQVLSLEQSMFRLFATEQESADQLTSSLSFRILGRSIGCIPRSVNIQLQVCAVAAQGHTQTNRLKQGMRHCPAKAEFLIAVKIQQPVPRQSRGCFFGFSIA